MYLQPAITADRRRNCSYVTLLLAGTEGQVHTQLHFEGSQLWKSSFGKQHFYISNEGEKTSL